METNNLNSTKHIAKKLIVSEQEPTEATDVIWVHSDSTHGKLIFSYWDNNQWKVITQGGGSGSGDSVSYESEEFIDTQKIGTLTINEIPIDVVIPDAPSDNKKYARKGGEWVEINEGSSTTLINNLTTETAGQGALDAAQGKILKGLIDALTDTVGPLTSLSTSDKTSIVNAINSIVTSQMNYIKLTQAEYDAITTKSSGILYIIVD